MNSLTIGLLCTASILVGGLLGMRMQLLLPSHHLSKEMQDLVKLSAGMIATLTALVLGLLVSSAKSSFDATNNGIVQSAAKFILLDKVLARYGPETKVAREQLKQGLAAGMERVWPEEKTGVSALTAFERGNSLDIALGHLRELTPKTDAQRGDLAQAEQMVNDLGQTRWLLIEEAQSPLPLPLLLILVFWLVLLFVSFGLFAPRNFMAVAVLFIGACAVSAAIFLVLELDHPLDGAIKVSNAPLRNALRHMGE
jgi:hypothetical protein